MIPEIGHFSLILAFCFALVQGIMPLIGVARKNESLMHFAVPAARAQFVFIVISFLCLDYAFYSNDFSVLYVASNSNSHLPIIYRLAAIWGGHEGSMLLWVSILALWTMAVTFFAQ